MFIEFGLDLNLVVYSRMDIIAKRPWILKCLQDIGVKLIFYGIESHTQSGLNYIDKKLTLKHQKRAAALTRQSGLKVWASVMALPGDTEKSWKRTIMFTKQEIAPVFSQVGICTPFPDSKLFNTLREE